MLLKLSFMFLILFIPQICWGFAVLLLMKSFQLTLWTTSNQYSFPLAALVLTGNLGLMACSLQFLRYLGF